MSEGTQSWEVLNTKVEFQGQQIEKLADETAKQFVDFREDTGKQLTSLRQDFKGEFGAVRSTLDSLSTMFANNVSERDKSSRGSWIAFLGTGLSAVGISATLLGTLATLRLTPIENDVKNLKEGQTSISSTMAANQASVLSLIGKITDKLDNFETRAELTERNKAVDAEVANKADKTALDFAIRERVAVADRLRQDVLEAKSINIEQGKQIVDLRIALAKVEVRQEQRDAEIKRVYTEIDKRATSEALDGLRLRLTDQRDRTNILSSRVQDLSVKAGVNSTEKIEIAPEARTKDDGRGR